MSQLTIPITSENTGNLALIRRAVTYLKKHAVFIFLTVILAGLGGLLDAVLPFGVKAYLDFVLGKAITLGPITVPAFPIWFIPLFILGFNLIQGTCYYISGILSYKVGQRINIEIKTELYERLLHQDLDFIESSHGGEILNRYYHDPESSCVLFLDYLKQAVMKFFSATSLTVTLFVLSWKMALAAILILGCTFIPISLINKKLKALVNSRLYLTGHSMLQYNESVSGIKLILANNLQNFRLGKLNELMLESFRVGLKQSHLHNFIRPINHTLTGFGVSFVLLYGTYLIHINEFSLASFSAFLASLLLLYSPFKSLSNSTVQLQYSILAMQRVFTLMDLVPKIQNPKNPVSHKVFTDAIEFRNVYFQYKADRPVLEDVSFTVEKGQTVALVGESGSGKTTIAHLLPRFYDVTRGQILMDGHEITRLTLQEIRNNIAIVFQDNPIFRGTLRENLLLGNLTASEEDIHNALEMAYLSDFVRTLPNGLDSKVNERGVNLSGGQRQRLAIARAFLKNSPIVIFDEATSSLDNISESYVQKAMETLMQNRTVIVIAHRLSTIQNADKILVLNQGRVVEEGTHDSLLAKQGAYYNLYRSQDALPLEERETAHAG